MAHRRPADLTYGLWQLHESLCLYESIVLHAVAAEMSQVAEVETVGQLRQLLTQLIFTDPPVYADELDEFAADDPWDLTQSGKFEDGEWPPMPTQAIFQVFDADDPIWADFYQVVGCYREKTAINGTILMIPPGREQDLLRTLHQYGMRATRDDLLIERVAGDYLFK